MKLITLYISAAYLATLVTAQKPPISITSPLANTHYKAGSEAIISWVNPSVKTISQIVLAKGSSTSLQPVMTIATNVNADDLKYVWKIPIELPDGQDYAFEIGTSPDIAFTGVFTIEGGTGGPLPSQNTSSSSPASPSSSSSSSSGSSSSGSSSAGSSSAGSSAGSAPSGTSVTKAAESPNVSHTSAATKTQSSWMAVGMVALLAAKQFF
ncbi:hypothetical protein G6F56_004150 [Rhizopus delemar]|uniref:Yeast cell wall synthesis Kre9/Knh1-like N-terminal domain-containing protein n=1 Tax=Rhizopus stolonifer TaxID=4846 RepID=A0A367IL56_RHIST|nr:hypothetical protein G6F56_004150 [Rhizopus delemar]RCH78366.1 hypothetical protein CU098_004743 [Rhizopus stolonifer]